MGRLGGARQRRAAQGKEGRSTPGAPAGTLAGTRTHVPSCCSPGAGGSHPWRAPAARPAVAATPPLGPPYGLRASHSRRVVTQPDSSLCTRHGRVVLLAKRGDSATLVPVAQISPPTTGRTGRGRCPGSAAPAPSRLSHPRGVFSFSKEAPCAAWGHFWLKTAAADTVPRAMEREEQPVVMEFEHALGYVQAVKQALSPTAYSAFLDILRAYREDWCVSLCGLGPLQWSGSLAVRCRGGPEHPRRRVWTTAACFCRLYPQPNADTTCARRTPTASTLACASQPHQRGREEQVRLAVREAPTPGGGPRVLSSSQLWRRLSSAAGRAGRTAGADARLPGRRGTPRPVLRVRRGGGRRQCQCPVRGPRGQPAPPALRGALTFPRGPRVTSRRYCGVPLFL